MDESVPIARMWARTALAGRVPVTVLDDTLLLLSEIATNAVAHSDSGPSGHITLRLTLTPESVRVEVADAGSATSVPAVRVAEIEDESGRGMWLVDRLAGAWGFDRTLGRGSVWFRISLSGR
ncbi:ATP-binding protein [Spongiactinospora sp. TRM90649]|uniref:ATP-binding protein n=1 Tax=Spongiactinospora sp. TRM90649 TaxID=3031114 RepID=UPI0023F74B65|nr:ATP-binding protein [Spongiactinospora sp. TRM90649]MDF5755565.1 ATP-binding protein [Spongiactinospora sp. TRM90649]